MRPPGLSALPSRIIRRLARPWLWRLSRYRSRPVSAAIRQRSMEPAGQQGEPLAGRLAVVSSFRIVDDDRWRMLEAVTQQVHGALDGSGIHAYVADASDLERSTSVAELWRATGLEVHYQRRPEPLARSLQATLRSIPERHFLLQFDDMLAAGLSHEYLEGASRLLDHYQGLVDVVCPIWALETSLDHERRVVRVISHRRRGASFDFSMARAVLPVVVEHSAGLDFAIFENFNYGFFFNSLVAPVDDYLRRLNWYLDHLGTESVHAIEMAAASKLRGPWWTHIGVCLGGVGILDIDYAHTSTAVRGEVPANRAVCDALLDGWQIEVDGRQGRGYGSR